MIGIIGAMEVEITTLLNKLQDKQTIDLGIRTFYKGLINNKEVVIVQAGIGKVNASITTSLLIENFDISQVINIGVAGGQNGVTHKDVVISSEVVHHDVDVTKFGRYKHGQVPGHNPTFIADKELLQKTESILKKLHFNYKIGLIASGDQFVYNSNELNQINKEYKNIYAIEMEAAAIAQTASIYNIPFIVYRSISDVIDDENQAHDFEKFVEEASINASLVLEKLIEVI